jgi:HAD superfamily hydrolase (TIGR01509 family)
MVHIQWKERYNIGYKEIDAQHKVLLDLLNELIDLAGGSGHPDQITNIFHRLYEYVVTHFSTEERYMRICKYPRLAEHEAQHASFIQKMIELNNAFDPEDPHLLDETLDFIKNWYIDHILKSDLDYVPSMKHYYGEAPIRAVIFDFGNVLCGFDNAKFLEGLAKLSGTPAKELETRLYHDSTLTQEYDRGEISSAGFLAGVTSLCGVDLPEAEFIQVYTDIFTPNPAVFDLVQRIKRHHRVGLLSNTNPWYFEHVIAKTEIFPLFDSVTLSYEVGASKPDPRLFDDALQKLDLMAEECVFIDDQSANAQAATEHLLHGIVYTTPIALMAELRRHKVTF